MAFDPENPPEIIVVGAGLAGLTAALHLAERGLPVRLLEADALYAGGRMWGGAPHPSAPLAGREARGAAGQAGGEGGAVTFTLRGHTQTFYPEHGMHGLWNNYQNVRATLERFRVAPDIVPAREQAWIHAEGERVLWAEVGRLISYATLPPPLHYLELFGSHRFLGMLGLRDWLALPWVWRSLLLAVALDPFERVIPLEGQALEDFFQGWSPRLRAMFVGLARSGLASYDDQITLAAFLAALRFYSVLRRDSLRFVYFTRNAGTELINPLVERLQERAGELLLGHTAEALLARPDGRPGWGVRVTTPRGPRTFLADHVVLAVDAPAAERLLLESEATRAGAAGLRWPAGLPNGTVRIWFDRPPRDGPEGGIFTGDFSVDNFFWLERIQPEFAAWARATGGSAIEMHLYRPPQFFAQPDAAILAQAVQDLYRAYPELRGHAVHQMLQRNPAVQTRLTVYPAQHWLGVTTPWPALWACGDWVRGPWPALFIERACVSGLEAANAVLGAAGLDPFPVAAYDPPEWLAGRIQSWMLGGRAWFRARAGRRPSR